MQGTFFDKSEDLHIKTISSHHRPHRKDGVKSGPNGKVTQIKGKSFREKVKQTVKKTERRRRDPRLPFSRNKTD